MKNKSRIRFYLEFCILLIILEINTTVFSSDSSSEIKPCKATKESVCVILCSNCEIHSEKGVMGLKEILRTERQKFKICTLIVKSCILTNETIGFQEEINLDEEPKIENLQIFHSSMDFNDFSPKFVKNLRELTLENTTTVSLQPKAFRHLPKLQKLQMNRNNLLKWVEEGFLESLPLQYLKIQGVNLTQPETVRFFKNFTGGYQIPSIRTLDWSHNNFGYFTKDLLTHFPNLSVLTLTNSSILNFEENIFDKGNIKTVFFDNNKIEKLPEKVYKSLIANATFVSLEGNPLSCDCDMKWLSNMMKHRKINLKMNCTEKCPENSENVDFSSVHCAPKENLEISTDYKSWLNTTKSKEAPRKFLIKQDTPEFLEIELTNTTELERAFLWYGNYANTTPPQFNCLKILQRKFTIYVMPDVSYLICLVMIHKYVQIDIFDCLPMRTKPLHENQTWLTKKSIPLSIICIFVVFLFALTMGALVLYLSIRKNPSLIRGSKRVIEVKRHDKAQLLVMPRGYENVRRADGSSLAMLNSSLPLEPSMSYDTISTVSYVSANQPTQLEILTYRLSRLRELFQRNNNIPMQIATPINRRLPPDVDLLFEYEWYTITTTTEM